MFADMKSMVMKAWHEHYALLAIKLYESEKCSRSYPRGGEESRSDHSQSLSGASGAFFLHPSRRQWLNARGICLSTGRSGA